MMYLTYIRHHTLVRHLHHVLNRHRNDCIAPDLYKIWHSIVWDDAEHCTSSELLRCGSGLCLCHTNTYTCARNSTHTYTHTLIHAHNAGKHRQRRRHCSKDGATTTFQAYFHSLTTTLYTAVLHPVSVYILCAHRKRGKCFKCICGGLCVCMCAIASRPAHFAAFNLFTFVSFLRIRMWAVCARLCILCHTSKFHKRCRHFHRSLSPLFTGPLAPLLAG